MTNTSVHELSAQEVHARRAGTSGSNLTKPGRSAVPNLAPLKVSSLTSAPQVKDIGPADTGSINTYGRERPEHPAVYRVAGMLKWDGRIVGVSADDGYFTAELTPFGGGQSVLADFVSSVLQDESDPHEGDLIYVTVRTIARPGGLSTQTAAVRLRRLGRWTQEEISSIDERASARLALFSKRAEPVDF